jgi:hypothetical protein
MKTILMKIRRLVVLFAMLAALTASSISATAEEGGGGVITGLGSTTLGGSVGSTIGVGLEPTRHEDCRGWWHIFLCHLGFYRGI